MPAANEIKNMMGSTDMMLSDPFRDLVPSVEAILQNFFYCFFIQVILSTFACIHVDQLIVIW